MKHNLALVREIIKIYGYDVCINIQGSCLMILKG